MVKKAEISGHVLDAALKLAAERGWRRLRLADIAVAAGLPLATVAETFGSKAEIQSAFSRRIDLAVLQGSDLADLDQPVRDRLFDVIMRRLDALKPHRAALGAIAHDTARDPVAGACAGAVLVRSMAAMLEAAGVSASGLGGLIRAEGLAAIYLQVLRVWVGDESEDLSKTMAALDRRLDRADWIMARQCGVSRRRPAAPAAAAAATGEAQ